MVAENKAEIWTKRIIEMKASGKPQKQWCEENGIKYNTIRSWFRVLNKGSKNKFEQESQENKFSKNRIIEDKNSKWLKVSLEAKSLEPAASEGIIEINIGKFSVNVPDKFNAETFSNVMKSLLEIC